MRGFEDIDIIIVFTPLSVHSQTNHFISKRLGIIDGSFSTIVVWITSSLQDEFEAALTIIRDNQALLVQFLFV